MTDKIQTYRTELAIKAAQCAALLLSDLQELASDNAWLTIMILPEIEKTAQLKFKLEAIAFALTQNQGE